MLARTSVYRFQPKMAITMSWRAYTYESSRKELRTQETYRGGGYRKQKTLIFKKEWKEGLHESGNKKVRSPSE